MILILVLHLISGILWNFSLKTLFWGSLSRLYWHDCFNLIIWSMLKGLLLPLICINQVKDIVIRWECSTRGRDRKFFSWIYRSKRLIGGARGRWRNIVQNNLKQRVKVYCIPLTHDAFSWRTVIYTAMELWLYKWRRISWVTEMTGSLLFVLRHLVDCDSIQPNQKH